MHKASALLGMVLLLWTAQSLWAAGQGFTALTVTASDPNGDPLTYLWEVVEYNGQAYVPTTHPPVSFDGAYPDTPQAGAGRTAGFITAGSYRLKVTVSDGVASASDSSLLLTVNAAPGSSPAAPTNLAVAPVSSSQIDLAWTDNANNETGFSIERAQGIGGTLAVTLKTYNGAYTAPTVQAAGSANSFKAGALVVNDRVDTWTAVPASLSGLARLLAARDDRTLPPVAGKYVVTISGTCTLYLPLDPRYGGAKLTWMDASWTDSGLTCSSSASSGWKIWKKSVAAEGDVTLGCDELGVDGVCYLFEGGSSFVQVASEGANVAGYSDTGLSASTTYTYRVRATNGTGNSGYSNAASATTLSGGTANVPPQIESAPWANPNPVALPNGTAVNVVASDPDQGPSALTYSWSKVSGAGTASFSPNGTAASDLSTASFSAAGSYVLRVTVSDGAASVSGEVQVTVNADPNSFTVTIASVSTGKAYALGVAQAGAAQYIDRTYTLTSLSATLAGGTLIRTANDDKYVTAAAHLAFSVSAPAQVYVCYDSRSAVLPAWLNDGSWTLAADTVSTTDMFPKVYRKNVPAGAVTLGGNLQAPASGAASNYFVVVK